MNLIKDTHMLKQILTQWQEQLGQIPYDYLCYDMELTGTSFFEDLVVELGYCLVQNGKADEYHSHVIDWSCEPDIDQEALKERLEQCAAHMAKSGRTYHMTYDRMRKEGQPVRDVLNEYVEIFNIAKEEKLFIVGHNAVQFDNPRFELAVHDWLGIDWHFPELVFDTAAVEKASLTGMPPWDEESMHEYFLRVLDAPTPGVKYNLDGWCVDKYNLLDKYPGLNLKDAHTAGFDAMLVHLLLEEFRGSSYEEED